MFSKRTQLCIDVLVTVGSAPPGALVTTQALVERLATSVSHIESIMKLLREGGFVRSVRGPGGGYSIARHPDQISIWAVVRAVGAPEESQAPPSNPSGLTGSLENQLHATVEAYLSTRTIGEFVEPDHAWNTRPAPMRFGFGLGPKPTSLMPVAPNSVFQLSSFLHGALA